jgi:ABC-type glycerol-3-phosphate transport system permease component
MIQSAQIFENQKRKKPVPIGKAIGYTILCAVGLFYLAPVLWLLDVSFRPQYEIFAVPPAIFQKIPWETFGTYTLEAFRGAIKYDVQLSVFNSAFLCIAGVTLMLLVVSWAAYGFACMHFPGKNFLFWVVIGTMMLPSATMLAPFYRTMRILGLIDTLWGLVLLYAASAYGFFLLRQYIIRLPGSLMEGAAIDGANRFQIWWHIILPLAKPALAALAILQFRGIWNDFLTPMILLKSDKLFTIPIKLQYIDSFVVNRRYDVIMATGLVGILIPVIFFLIFQKQFVEGLSGGVKG